MSASWPSLQLNAKNIRYVVAAFGVLVTLALLLRLGHTSDRDAPPIYYGQVSGTTSAARQKSLQPILNSTLGFGGILAVNLPERTDHRDGLVLASAVSNMDIEFVDGVHGDQILDKVLPSEHANDLSDARKGSWRAHINAIRRVVESGWSTALIMEDDVDWDIRLRGQLQDFALASDYLLRSNANSGIVPMKNIRTHSVPQTSSYGDNWDLLWLGHCGMQLPSEAESIVVLLEDETVPEAHYQKSWDVNAESPMIKFPTHSRAVMAPHDSTCSLAYAVSQMGARKILYSIGLRKFDLPFDLMLRDFCQGRNGREKHVCVGVLPQLFDHYRRPGPSEIDSDISPPNGQVREKAYTLNIRWSTRINMNKLLTGEMSYIDQYPDTS